MLTSICSPQLAAGAINGELICCITGGLDAEDEKGLGLMHCITSMLQSMTLNPKMTWDHRKHKHPFFVVLK